MWMSPICPNCAYGRLSTDRDHHEAPHKSRTIRIDGNAGIGIDIGYHGGLAVQHGPAAYTGSHGEFLAFPERTNRILVGIEAFVALAKDKACAIGARKFACRSPDYGNNSLKRMGLG